MGGRSVIARLVINRSLRAVEKFAGIRLTSPPQRLGLLLVRIGQADRLDPVGSAWRGISLNYLFMDRLFLTSCYRLQSGDAT